MLKKNFEIQKKIKKKKIDNNIYTLTLSSNNEYFYIKT